MSRRWEHYSDSDHDTMERMWADGRKIWEIAQALDKTVGGVYGYIREHRDSFPYRRMHVTPEEHQQILELRKKGWSADKIGQYMGICDETARRHIKREGRA